MGADLRHARLVIAAAFLTQGLVFISLTTRLPRIQDRWDLDELALSGVLLRMVLLAGAGSLLAERLAPRLDSAGVLPAGLVTVAVSVAVAILAPTTLVLVLGLAAYGVGLGLVDATGNMQAVALEHRLGRVGLPSCHGAWTLGGVIGGGRLALVVFYTVDTAAATWGPVYLDDVFGAPEELVALVTLPYLVASGLVRLVGDRLTEQVGAVRLLRVGAGIALVSLAVIVAAPSWPVAVLGFTLLGCGVAVVAPLSFSAAAALAGRDADPATRQARVDAVVARFNQFNYAGALLGAVMTGAVGASSLHIGFAVPLVLVLALFWLARAFAPADELSADARQ